MNRLCETPSEAGGARPRRLPDSSNSYQEDLYVRLGFLIHDVSRLRRTAFDRMVRSLHITRSQCWVLVYLSRHDGIMQAALSERMEVRKVAIGGLLDRLEDHGFVVRRADRNDRRIRRVYLTRAADTLLKRMRVVERSLDAGILDAIGEADCEDVSRLLTRLKRNLVSMNGTCEELNELSRMPPSRTRISNSAQLRNLRKRIRESRTVCRSSKAAYWKGTILPISKCPQK